MIWYFWLLWIAGLHFTLTALLDFAKDPGAGAAFTAASWIWIVFATFREMWHLTPIGTRSVLVGAHQFILHPLILAFCWWWEYGFRAVEIGRRRKHYRGIGYSVPEYASLWRPALWVAFIVHDIGYVGKVDMDGIDGATHPEVGAKIMRALFGEPWGDFVLLHSRNYAARLQRPVSPLCVADKWAIVLEPAWLYLPRVWLSGEYSEFREHGRRRALDPVGLYHSEWEGFANGGPFGWQRALKSYTRRWIERHQQQRVAA
jgi:hypothetical protein